MACAAVVLFDTGGSEGRGGGLLDGVPGAGDAQAEAGGAAGALGQVRAVSARKAHARAGAAAVDAKKKVDHVDGCAGKVRAL
jgi:hypothetical protein